MIHADPLANPQDAFIIRSLQEAQRRRLTRTQTLKYVGLPAEVIDQAVQRAMDNIPALPPEAPPAGPQAIEAAVEAAAEAPSGPMPETAPQAMLEPVPEPAPEPVPEPAPGLEMREEPVTGQAWTPEPAAETRKQAASKGRANLAAARKARTEGAGEGPMTASVSEPRRAHRATGHQPKATRQQIHASFEARIPMLNQLLDAGLPANEIAKKMNLGTARVYQIARQAGRPFGGVAKPGKAAQEPSAA